MNKISNFFSNISISIKEFIKYYPVSIILVAILTLYYAFNTSVSNNISFIFNTLIIFFFGTLFTETTFNNKKTAKIISFIINFVI